MSDELGHDEGHLGATPDNDRLLVDAPRDVPSALSSKVVGWFAGWTALGLIVGGVFLGIGWSNNNDYLETRAMLYQGEVADGLAQALSDDEDTWAVVDVSYGGQTAVNTFVQVTDEQMAEISSNTSSGKFTTITVAFWPEEFTLDATQALANEAEFTSVDFIKAESKIGAFAWAYYVAILCLAIFFLIGLMGMLKRKRRYEHGVETWAAPISEVSFDGDSSKFSVTVSYQASGETQTENISWAQGANPLVKSDSGELLGIVAPNSPGSFHVLSDAEAQALFR